MVAIMAKKMDFVNACSPGMKAVKNVAPPKR